MVQKNIVITATGSGSNTLPSDWTNTNTIEVIGGGGGGSLGTIGWGAPAGAYAKISNYAVNPGTTYYWSVGTGGNGGISGFANGTDGGNTWVNFQAAASPTTTANGVRACAGNGVTGGAVTAPTAANSLGTIIYTGGTCIGALGDGGGGGGGAGGPNGNGGSGGQAGTGLSGGGGGGGASGGANGVNTAAGFSNGGVGGANFFGVGGGIGGISTFANGATGSNGAGGGGGFSGGTPGSGGIGGNGIEWISYGAGGGGAGGGYSTTLPAGNGGLYGGGGGGGGFGATAPTAGLGGNGAPGIIVLKYTSRSLDYVPSDKIVEMAAQSITASSATVNIDLSLGSYVILTLSATVTTMTITNWPPADCNLILDVRNQGAFNITGWGGAKWAGGTLPTVTSGAGKKDVFTLFSGDGGTDSYGAIVGQNYS